MRIPSWNSRENSWELTRFGKVSKFYVQGFTNCTSHQIKSCVQCNAQNSQLGYISCEQVLDEKRFVLPKTASGLQCSFSSAKNVSFSFRFMDSIYSYFSGKKEKKSKDRKMICGQAMHAKILIHVPLNFLNGLNDDQNTSRRFWGFWPSFIFSEGRKLGQKAEIGWMCFDGQTLNLKYLWPKDKV